MNKPKPRPSTQRKPRSPQQATPQKDKKAASDEVRVPHDPVNEMVVIAAVIVDTKAADKYLPAISADNFYGKGHAVIWATLQEMQRRNLHYDPATAQQLAGAEFDVQLVAEYLEQRPQLPPNLKHHVQQIAWDRTRVEAVRGPIHSLLDALRDPTADPGRVRALSNQVGKAFEGHGSGAFLRNPDELLREADRELTRRREGIACYPYGLPALDCYTQGDTDKEGNSIEGRSRLIPGAAPTKITLVTGVTGSGKSTSTKRMILGMVHQKRKICIGAWEEGEAPTLETLAAMDLGWSRTDLMTGEYDEADQQVLRKRMDDLQEYIKFFRLPKPKKGKGMGLEQLELIQNVVNDSGAEVFVADLLRRAIGNLDPGEEAAFLYELQDWGAVQRIHQVWVHQQRFKDVEQRKDKRPTREAVKGIGEWVEVADAVLGWHRQALWKNVPDNKIECIILKQRFGPWPQAIEFDYDAEDGYIGEGWTIPYDRPGTDNALDDDLFGDRK